MIVESTDAVAERDSAGFRDDGVSRYGPLTQEINDKNR